MRYIAFFLISSGKKPGTSFAFSDIRKMSEKIVSMRN